MKGWSFQLAVLLGVASEQEEKRLVSLTSLLWDIVKQAEQRVLQGRDTLGEVARTWDRVYENLKGEGLTHQPLQFVNRLDTLDSLGDVTNNQEKEMVTMTRRELIAISQIQFTYFYLGFIRAIRAEVNRRPEERFQEVENKSLVAGLETFFSRAKTD